MFLRQHNKIARDLSSRHPEWDDETVFQETRKIVGALMQRITYSEYLPYIIGTDAMAEYELSEGVNNY